MARYANRLSVSGLSAVFFLLPLQIFLDVVERARSDFLLFHVRQFRNRSDLYAYLNVEHVDRGGTIDRVRKIDRRWICILSLNRVC